MTVFSPMSIVSIGVLMLPTVHLLARDEVQWRAAGAGRVEGKAKRTHNATLPRGWPPSSGARGWEGEAGRRPCAASSPMADAGGAEDGRRTRRPLDGRRIPMGPLARRTRSGIRASASSPLSSLAPPAPLIDTAPIIFKFQDRAAAA